MEEEEKGTQTILVGVEGELVGVMAEVVEKPVLGVMMEVIAAAKTVWVWAVHPLLVILNIVQVEMGVWRLVA